MSGDAVFRAIAGLFPSFQPGQSWVPLRGRVDNALSSLGLGELDCLIDTSTFGDACVSSAGGRRGPQPARPTRSQPPWIGLWKAGFGMQGFARSALAVPR